MISSEIMKVQLIFAPPFKRYRFGELSEQVSAPLGLLYIAAFLRERIKDIEIKITDGTRIGYDRSVEEIRSFKPDVVGISFYTSVALSAYKLVNLLKEESPGLLVVLGGPHASALPYEGLAQSKADIIAIGEGEQTFFEIIKNYKQNGPLSKRGWERVDGIAYRADNGICLTPGRELIENLDSIPLPARDLIDPRLYSGFYLTRNTPEATMSFSRGCLSSCTFCANLLWKNPLPSLRSRSPKHIADEIELLKDRFGIREILEYSGSFNSNVNAIAICEELIKRKLNITWKTSIRAHPLPEILVKKMADSGCWYVQLGIESANPQTLKGVRKNITLEQVKQACVLLKKYNMRILGFFMLYNVWEENGQLMFEDSKMSRNTVKLAERMLNEKLLDYISLFDTIPYPGSPLYDIALRHNLIKKELLGNWDEWLRNRAQIINLPGISKKERINIKTRSAIIQAKFLLKAGGYGIKDACYISRKALGILYNQIKK